MSSLDGGSKIQLAITADQGLINGHQRGKHRSAGRPVMAKQNAGQLWVHMQTP